MIYLFMSWQIDVGIGGATYLLNTRLHVLSKEFHILNCNWYFPLLIGTIGLFCHVSYISPTGYQCFPGYYWKCWHLLSQGYETPILLQRFLKICPSNRSSIFIMDGITYIPAHGVPTEDKRWGVDWLRQQMPQVLNGSPSDNTM